MYLKRGGAIATFADEHVILVDEFTYFVNLVPPTESDNNMCPAKARTVIDRLLSIITVPKRHVTLPRHQIDICRARTSHIRLYLNGPKKSASVELPLESQSDPVVT